MSTLTLRPVGDVGMKYPVGLDPTEHQYADVESNDGTDFDSIPDDTNNFVDESEDDRFSEADTERTSSAFEDSDAEMDIDSEFVEDKPTPTIQFKKLRAANISTISYANILQEEDDFFPE